MTARLELTFSGETMAEIHAAMRAELERVDRGVYGPAPAPPAAVAGIQCSGGHGPMRLVPAGTAKSGPRIGQAYPAFLTCDTCRERREVSA